MKDSLEKDLGAKFSSMSRLVNLSPALDNPSVELPSKDFFFSADILNNVDEKVGQCSTHMADPNLNEQKITVTLRDEIFDIEYKAEVNILISLPDDGDDSGSMFRAATTKTAADIIRESKSDIDSIKIKYVHKTLTDFIHSLVTLMVTVREPQS